MTSTKRTNDRLAALAALEGAQAVNDGQIDALPSAKPLGRRVAYIAQALGGISERCVTNLLNEKKKPGRPKLCGFRIGKIWMATDEAIAKYVDECERVGRGEAIE